jgi:hypothetical protein
MRDIGERCFVFSHDFRPESSDQLLFCADQVPKIIARTGNSQQIVECCVPGHLAAFYEQLTLGDFAHQLEESVVRN